MFYRGLIIIATFLIIILLTIRTIVISKFGAAPHQVPLLGISLVPIGWFSGREYDKSVYKANIYALTGLYNRRFVYDRVLKIFSKARKRDEQLAIV